jgi:hypothetical protein
MGTTFVSLDEAEEPVPPNGTACIVEAMRLLRAAGQDKGTRHDNVATANLLRGAQVWVQMAQHLDGTSVPGERIPLARVREQLGELLLQVTPGIVETAAEHEPDDSPNNLILKGWRMCHQQFAQALELSDLLDPAAVVPAAVGEAAPA